MVLWNAGDIIGALTDTMEEESLKEGWRRLGGAFSPPDNQSIFFGRAVLAKRGSHPVQELIQS